MNWVEKVFASDAGRGARERAEELVREAGGEVPETTIPDPPEAHTSSGCACTHD